MGIYAYTTSPSRKATIEVTRPDGTKFWADVQVYKYAFKHWYSGWDAEEKNQRCFNRYCMPGVRAFDSKHLEPLQYGIVASDKGEVDLGQPVFVTGGIVAPTEPEDSLPRIGFVTDVRKGVKLHKHTGYVRD